MTDVYLHITTLKRYPIEKRIVEKKTVNNSNIVNWLPNVRTIKTESIKTKNGTNQINPTKFN